MKKQIQCQIESEEIKSTSFPVSGVVKMQVKVKCGSISKSVQVKLMESPDMDKETFDKFLKEVAFMHEVIELKCNLSTSYRKIVELDICEMCGIGTGTTKYPDGKFKHTDEKLLKLYQHDVCSECYEMCKDKDKKDFLHKLKKNETENSSEVFSEDAKGGE